jgi:uncharacterized protein YjlB
MGELHFFKEIDAYGIFVPFAGQKHLDKVGDHAELKNLAGLDTLVHGSGRIGSVGSLAAGDKVLLPQAFGHLRERESLKPATHGATFVAIGEAANEDLIKRGPGDHAELSELGNSLSEAPI